MSLSADVLTPPIVLAAVGGLTVNVLNLLELKNIAKERRPDLTDILYWLPFSVWPVLGGVLACLYDDPGSPLRKIVAFQIGMSAPLILRTMANVVPAQVRATLPPGA